MLFQKLISSKIVNNRYKICYYLNLNYLNHEMYSQPAKLSTKGKNKISRWQNIIIILLLFLFYFYVNKDGDEIPMRLTI